MPRIITHYRDDLDGSEGDDVARRSFEHMGRRFAIDLSEANHARLTEALALVNECVEKANEFPLQPEEAE